jgi:pyruvate, water dikinase
MKPHALHEAHDESEFGGKAFHLALSLKAGLPVPPGFALGVAHVEAVASGHEEALAHLRVEFASLGGPCAVRSSAIGEDSEGASFAGQHLTILNVRTAEDVTPAVLRVRESAHTEGALAYRRQMGLEERPRIAVVVQRMIEPDVAGVMFTRNPTTGADERVIEASWGLGESVVAGLIVPDNWVLARDGSVLSERIGVKDLALRSAPGGGTYEEEVDADLVEAPCLGADQLAQLHELASRCEAHFGMGGLDIEWAFSGGELYLLQYRAMTR